MTHGLYLTQANLTKNQIKHYEVLKWKLKVLINYNHVHSFVILTVCVMSIKYLFYD